MALRVFGGFLLFGGATASVSYFIYRRYWMRQPDDCLSNEESIKDKTDINICEDHSDGTLSDSGSLFESNFDFTKWKYLEVDDVKPKMDKKNPVWDDSTSDETDVEEDKRHNTVVSTDSDITMDYTNDVNKKDDVTMDNVDIDDTVKNVLDDIICKVEEVVSTANESEPFEEQQRNDSVMSTDSSSLLDSKFDFMKWKWMDVEDVKIEEPKVDKDCCKKKRKRFKGLRKFFKGLSCMRKAGDE